MTNKRPGIPTPRTSDRALNQTLQAIIERLEKAEEDLVAVAVASAGGSTSTTIVGQPGARGLPGAPIPGLDGDDGEPFMFPGPPGASSQGPPGPMMLALDGEEGPEGLAGHIIYITEACCTKQQFGAAYMAFSEDEDEPEPMLVPGFIVVKRAGAAQAAVATTTATNVVPYGYTTQAQADAIVTLLNEVRAWAVAQGFWKGAA